MNALCFELDEDAEYVSRDIGYSRTGIYTWRQKYLKKRILALMTTNDLSIGKLPEKTFLIWRKTRK